MSKDWTRQDGRQFTDWARAGVWAQFDIGLMGQLSRAVSVLTAGDYSASITGVDAHTWGGRLGVKVTW